MRISTILAVSLLSASLLPTSAARAMAIRQFDKMANQDQSEYIGALVVGAERVLTDQGKPDLAAKVNYLFTTKLGSDADVIGAVEFERNLALARLADLRNVAKNPNAKRIEVEDALGVTLQKNHIDLPDSFYTVMSNFYPKYPPKQ